MFNSTWSMPIWIVVPPFSKFAFWHNLWVMTFVDLLCFCSVLCLLCFVRVCLYVLFGHLLGKGWPLGSRLWCLLWVCHFPIGILGQVWYLIVSIPDLCTITYFCQITHFHMQNVFISKVKLILNTKVLKWNEHSICMRSVGIDQSVKNYPTIQCKFLCILKLRVSVFGKGSRIQFNEFRLADFWYRSFIGRPIW